MTNRGAQAAIAGAFCAVMAGPNLPTALLPSYRADFGLSSFGLSLLFAMYLVVLVPALLLAGKPWPRRNAALLLPLALLLAVAADLIMGLGAGTAEVVIGRALSGLSVGAATGAAAALVVAVAGERGRGSVATGNIIGGLLGTVLGVITAQWLHGPTVYFVHAGVVVLALTALLLALRGMSRSSVPVGTAAPGVAIGPGVAPGERTPVQERHAVLGTAAGAICWTAPALILALLPAMLRQATGPTGVLAATSPAVFFLATAWALQALVRRTRVGNLVTGQEVTIGTTACVVGLLILSGSALLQGSSASVPLAFLGCAFAAAGPALGYRGGMVLATQGLAAHWQSAATSRYAAICYGSSAVLTIGTGALGAATSIGIGLAAGTALLALCGAAVVAVILSSEAARFRAEAALTVPASGPRSVLPA
ncbi:MFS transporter [Nakamurella silvestris]|nr:MFS transporter [Nakamurella silvestris]